MADATPNQPESATDSVRRSSHALARSAGAQEESADRRTELAADRTVLAAERTYAAWVRTGLAAMAASVGAKALFARLLPGWFGELVGSVLALFSGFCFVAAVWREMKPGAPPPEPDMRRLPPSVLLVTNGVLTVSALAVLIALWWTPA